MPSPRIAARLSLAIAAVLAHVACGSDDGDGDGSALDASSTGSVDGAPSGDASSDPRDASTDPADARTEPRDAAPSDSGGGVLRSIRIEIRTGTTTLHPAETATLAATGVLEDSSEIDLTRAATWRSSSSTVARVLAGGVLIAGAPGVTVVRASRGAIDSDELRFTVEPIDTTRRELRGVWVSRWTFGSAADLARIVGEVDAANMNAIFFQVRGTADAYYESTLEPWAARLGGGLGRDPGWDPLGEMVRLAHQRNIQVHAWINTFPAWSGNTAPAESTPRHKLLSNPEWLCADERGVPMPLGSMPYQFFSPGNAAARAHIASVAEEIASRYAVDGLHFDFVRYPGRAYCHDAASEAELQMERTRTATLTFEDFARSRITIVLRDIRARLERVRPAAALTVASWGIHKNLWGWSNVSRGFDDYYQDAHRWAREGVVDALCPMTYWALTTPRGLRTDFATLTDDHVAASRAGGRFVYSGISAEHSTRELLAQVAYARAAGANGFVFFDLTQLRSNGHIAPLVAGPFAERAVPPPMPWK